MNSLDLSTTRLADLVAKRRCCLEQLHALGVKQSELAREGNMSDLLRLLAAKQQLIVALQSIEVQLKPFHDQDPEARPWLSPAARANCAGDAEECRRLVDAVMALEAESEQTMTVRRDEVAHQLRSMQSAGRVRQAYQTHDLKCIRTQ